VKCSVISSCRKAPLDIHFIYLGNKEIYYISKTCYILLKIRGILFLTKCCLFHNFIILCSNIMFFINHVYPGWLKVTVGLMFDWCRPFLKVPSHF
jgi:hypothetical protein